MLISFQHRIGLAGKFEENKSQVGIINRGDLLLMVKKGMRDGICHAANRYVKVNNKCTTDYYSSTESSYLMYGDGSNLYGQTMRQRLPVDG